MSNSAKRLLVFMSLFTALFFANASKVVISDLGGQDQKVGYMAASLIGTLIFAGMSYNLLKDEK